MALLEKSRNVKIIIFLCSFDFENSGIQKKFWSWPNNFEIIFLNQGRKLIREILEMSHTHRIVTLVCTIYVSNFTEIFWQIARCTFDKKTTLMAGWLVPFRSVGVRSSRNVNLYIPFFNKLQIFNSVNINPPQNL